MARANLTNDEIRWILTVDAHGAQKEIQTFSSEIDRLKRENEALAKATKDTNDFIKDQEKELKKLERQGRQNTVEYMDLANSIAEARYNIDQNTRAIEANNRAIDAQNRNISNVLRTMRIEDMTMSQLRKRAYELQKQLDHTSRSLSPEAWNRTARELQAVNARMNQLRGTASSLGGSLQGALMVFAGNMMTKAVNGLRRLASEAKRFIDNSIKMAASADGVKHAFDKLDQPGLLSNLRKATKNTVNDFELMKAAVQAKDFRIPLQELGKYLQFAQLKAQQTGQSVEYMTNSIVTGLGRKSVKIIDNLGISAAEVNEKVKKTGDFMTAVSEIVDKQLVSAGERYNASSDRTQRKTVLLENAQLKLGQRLLWVKDAYEDFVSYLAKDTINALSTAKEKYDEQLEKVVQLETEMPELLKQYEELTTKSNLSKEEQEKLKTVINSITEMVPGAVSAWGDYGEAIAISTDKVNEFIESQKALLEYRNKDAIKKAKEDIVEYEKKLKEAQKLYDQGGIIRFEGGNTMFESPKPVLDNRTETINKLKADIQEYGDLLKGAKLDLDDLTGKQLESYVNQARERKRFMAMEKEDLDVWIKNKENATSEYMEIAKQVYNARFVETEDPDAEKKTKEAEQATKKAWEEQFKIIDTALGKEINLLKKSRMEGVITEKEYNDKVEELTTEALKKKIAIKGQEAHQYIQYESQILDAQIKQQEEADKLLLQELTKAKDDKLKIIDSARNAQLESLQETESDQKIYALRTQEIEVNAVAGREAVIKEFGEILEQAEFKNILNRQKAIEENSKKIIDAETSSLKAREALMKKFAKTTADFERLYNIKNWEELREEELAIIERYRKENLISEETYQAALAAIEKKYLDEKQKARRQAMLTNMQDEYEYELEKLNELYKDKLLTVNEYERAIFKLRLKYAAEYANQVANYFGQMSQTVADLMTAETNKSPVFLQRLPDRSRIIPAHGQ